MRTTTETQAVATQGMALHGVARSTAQGTPPSARWRGSGQRITQLPGVLAYADTDAITQPSTVGLILGVLAARAIRP